MKKFFYVVLFGLILFNLTMPVQAQTEEESEPVEDASESGITISPPTIEITQSDLGKKYTITITNNSSEAVTLIATEKYVQRNENKQTKVIDHENSNMLDFSESAFTIEPGAEYSFIVRVKLSISSTDGIYPAIAFTESNNDSNVDIASEVLTVFLVQNFDGEASVDANIAINSSSLVTSKTISIDGDVINDGQKFYRPTGTIKVLRGETVLYEKQLTTQIDGLLFPEESVDYHLEWENTENPFSAIGTYTVEISISPTPFSITKIARIQYVYIPQEVIAAGGGGVVVLAGAVFGIIKFKKKKNENK